MEVTDMNNLSENLSRDLFVLEDETNPTTSQVNMIWPKTVLDQVFDQLSPTKRTLRDLLADLKQEILTGGLGNITFPVTSVNGQFDDVKITPFGIGLGRVDNTRDIDKPLSTPQKNTIMDILAGYNFKINLDALYAHLLDNTNPHGVNIDQINKDDALTTFIARMITAHSLSEERIVHLDIRNSLTKLWAYVDENINGGLDTRINNVLNIMNSHIDDPSAHFDVLKLKEDVLNKSVGFTTATGDHTKYPSTRAVIEFVNNAIQTFKGTLPDIKDYIVDIKTIENRSELPAANNGSIRNAYIIRTGNGSQNEIAICRMNPDNTYTWDISSLGSVSKFNSVYFEDSSDGLSIKLGTIVDAILTKTGDVDSTVSNILKDYYTKEEVENQFVRGITILPGTMDGKIRYYINNDQTTMSDDVAIPGLKNLAYMEYVTENEIRELAVQNRHMLNRSVDSRVLALKSVNREHIGDDWFTPDLLKTPVGTVLGNILNDDGTVHSITITTLADMIRSIYIGDPYVDIPGVVSPLLPVSPNKWVIGAENKFVDGSIGMRFQGTISVLPNASITTILSTTIITDKYQIMDAGGYWRTDSDANIDSLLGGTSVTGNTFGEVTMTKQHLQLDTISIGNRINSPYDIWVRYMPR